MKSLPLGLAVAESVHSKQAVTLPPILLEGDEPAAAPIIGPDQKFAVRPRPQRARLEPNPGELPEAYGTGRLLLTARDPQCLYAHWDLTLEQQRRYNELSLHHHLLVRVHGETLSSRPVTELPVHPESRHCFIHINGGANQYIAELGYYAPGGPWRVVAVSEAAITPAVAAVGDQPVRFATLTPTRPPSGQDQLTVPAAVFPGSGVVSEPARTPFSENSRPAFDTAEPGSIRFQLALTGIPLPPARFGTVEVPLPGVELSPVIPFPARSGPEVPDQATWPSTPVPTPVSEWTPAQERALAELIAWSLVRQEWIGSTEIEDLIRRKLRPAENYPAGEALPIQPAMVPPPISSAALVEASPPERPSFWLDVNAELVIYGATQPDAKVTIGGRPIHLRADGTFSYRFALPDGSYQLPIVAASAQGDVRRAELDFRRGTIYSGHVGSHPQDPALSAPLVENVS